MPSLCRKPIVLLEIAAEGYGFAWEVSLGSGRGHYIGIVCFGVNLTINELRNKAA